MKKYLLYCAAFLVIVAGCAKNENAVISKGEGSTISATIEGPTKALLSIDERCLFWSEGDKISLLDGSSNLEYTLSDGKGTKNGLFSSESTPASVSTYYAVYPYSLENEFEDSYLEVEFPSKLNYCASTCAADTSSNIMVACSSGSSFQFRNLCSYLLLTIKGEPESVVKSIVVENATADKVNGECEVSFTGNEVSTVSFADSDGTNSTTVNFIDGAALSSEGLKVNIALAPAFSEGFKVKIVLDDGSMQTLESGVALGRNNIIKMPDITFTPVNVAEVAGTQYASVMKAFEAANASSSDVTVKLLSDAVAMETITVNNSGAKVTLDLNGKKLSSRIASYSAFELKDSSNGGVIEASSSVIRLYESAAFTMNGGTVRATGGNYALYVEGSDSDASLRPSALINCGTIEAPEGDAIRSKYNKSIVLGGETAGDITVSGERIMWTSSSSNVTINRGTFTSTDENIYFGSNSTDVLVINGGTFTSGDEFFSYYKTSTNPSVTIAGGYFRWEDGESFSQAANSLLSITGGYFSGDVSSNVASGYECVASSEVSGYNYKVQVSADKSVMQVGSQKFESFEDAIAAANSAATDVTVKVLQNLEIESAISFTNTSAKITLDLNGHSVVASNTTTLYPAILIETNGVELTITDNSESASGKIDQKYAGAGNTVIINAGTVNLVKGTIANSSSSGYGRIAVKVAGVDGAVTPTLNVRGGYIFGGRAIAMGSAIEGVISTLNVTGGVIEGTYNTDGESSYQYGAIYFPNEYSSCTVTGGIILSGTGPCIYNSKKVNTTITIGDSEGKAPYLWTKSSTWCIRPGSSDAAKMFYIYDCYLNKNQVKYLAVKDNTGCDFETLDTPATDSGLREYQYRLYVKSE